MPANNLRVRRGGFGRRCERQITHRSPQPLGGDQPPTRIRVGSSDNMRLLK